MIRKSLFTTSISVFTALGAFVVPSLNAQEEVPANVAEGGAEALTAMEEPDFARWYVSPAIGWINFEGDEPLKDGFYFTIRLGRDLNEWWTVEGSLLVAPKLDENFGGSTDFATGEKTMVSKSKKDTDFGDTFMVQAYLDFLFHFTRWENLDPYLTFGIGAVVYGKDITGDGWSPEWRAGGGIMYHLSEEWALRADSRLNLAWYNTEFNHTIDLGVVWHWGAHKLVEPPTFDPRLLDSDGDGLPDWYELEIGTDPYNADTDGDGLSDGDEVNIYKTDPLNPDSDFDMLSDGAEVLIYKTDPLNPDTDGGGVWDGHEVLVDKTNPLDPLDDVMIFELDIQFDTDKSIIKPQYFADLDKIALVLQRNPAGTALIEGHADKRATSNRKHNLNLSQTRASAVRQYLVDKGINASRIRATGYGFDRPKAANDPVSGNIVNRRVDVYLYDVGGNKQKMQYVNP